MATSSFVSIEIWKEKKKQQITARDVKELK